MITKASNQNCALESAGFSLLEVLISMVLFCLVALGTAPVFINQVKQNVISEHRSGAIAAATQVLDHYRTVDVVAGDFPSSGTESEDVEIEGRTYLVTVAFCLKEEFCGANARHLLATVQFNEELIYEVETVYTKLR